MKATVKCPCCLGTGKRQDPAAIGRELRALRLQAGLMLEQVARRMGITASHLCYLEHGRRKWQPGQKEAYRKALL